MALITIVVPVYNEKDNIERLLTAIQKDVMVDFEIRIIYDREEDNTLSVVRRLKKSFSKPIELIKNYYGSGFLNAVKTGFESSQSKYIVVIMGDFSDPPIVVNEMVKSAEEKNASIVCGSRYMKGGKMHCGFTVKSLLSRMAGLSLCWFVNFPTHDATNAFRLYRKDFLDTVTIESVTGGELTLELVVKAFLDNKIICEVPTEWYDRESGESHFKIIEWLPQYLKWYFKAYKKYIL